jgi:hypothetical protein
MQMVVLLRVAREHSRVHYTRGVSQSEALQSRLGLALFQCNQVECILELSAGSAERLILQQGKPLTNEQARRWRIALSNVLSQGAVMQLQLPQIVTQFTSTIQKCAPDQSHVLLFPNKLLECD